MSPSNPGLLSMHLGAILIARGETVERDMDLFRKVLLEEESIPPTTNWASITVDGYGKDAVWYHAKLAQDVGFIVGKFLPGTFDFAVQRLTFPGHEFLDMARDENRWDKAKQKVKTTTGTLTVDALKTVLSFMIQAALKAALPQ